MGLAPARLACAVARSRRVAPSAQQAAGAARIPGLLARVLGGPWILAETLSSDQAAADTADSHPKTSVAPQAFDHASDSVSAFALAGGLSVHTGMISRSVPAATRLRWASLFSHPKTIVDQAFGHALDFALAFALAGGSSVGTGMVNCAVPAANKLPRASLFSRCSHASAKEPSYRAGHR